MNDENTSAVETREPGSKENVESVDQGRRRLGGAGTVVLLTLPSRSVMAASTCTASEIASGNLSRAAHANPCGCSPGFWGPQNQNGTALWTNSPSLNSVYSKSMAFNTVFGVNFFNGTGGSGIRLDQVFPGQTAGPGSGYGNAFGVPDNTAMQAVAALLNAKFYGSRYPVVGLQTATAVIAAFQAACANLSPKTALAAFVTQVDIYGHTANLWCNGSAE
ncbi:hypothetical protein [Roseateles koreensis]|uniref:Uncharacterized protein n=1 Tax=Roseateles koreensis TaxID=2987526 RepID=A0ABT5KR61_9BURK|nr:hypothetical protein [Roseateles koreensis]MDC8784868.1 hypothetical protein [Roseateles koreensis]